MYQHLKSRFRRDLIVTRLLRKADQKKAYLVKDPVSGKIFEFKEEEYFLCRLIDSDLTLKDILVALDQNFNIILTEKELNEFLQQIADHQLLESVESQVISTNLTIPQCQQNSSLTDRTTELRAIERKGQGHLFFQQSAEKLKINYIWSLPQSKFIFSKLALPFRPFGLLFKLLAWAAIAVAPIACLTIFYHQFSFWQDIHFYVEPIPYLTAFLFNLLLVCLSAKIAQGIVLTCLGGTVKQFGLFLVAGFLPRFYIERETPWRLSRTAQLWTASTPLLFRVALFGVSAIAWYSNRTTGTLLSTYALLTTQASVIDFLLDSNPFWPSDGYSWITAYFRLPELFGRSYLVWNTIFRRRPLPKKLSTKEKVGLQLFGVIGVVLSALLFVWIMLSMASGLAENFVASILGNAADKLLFASMCVIALVQLLSVSNRGRKAITSTQTCLVKVSKLDMQLTSTANKPVAWRKYSLNALILAGSGLLMLFPYEFRPSGQIKLLPPKQRDIQVELEGKVVQVLARGGSKNQIKAGTVIAVMEATNVDNDSLKMKERIRSQQAIIKRREADLAKLQATPRREEVEIATQRVEVAESEVEVAKRELNAALNQAELSSRKAERYKYLFNQGAFSQQQYEDEKRQADTRRDAVETWKKVLESKQQMLQQAGVSLTMVLSGPYSQEIDAAQSEVDSAYAELEILQQELKYLKGQQQRTKLVMPFDGFLMVSNLDEKVGRYLNKGDIFAVAVDNRDLLGEVRIPESMLDKLVPGKNVEVKLFAFQGQSFAGKVEVIQPIAVTDDTTGQTNLYEQSGKDVKIINETAGKVVKVLVKIEDPQKTAKPGMTGYAKIEGEKMPAIVAFSRSLVRFIRIEFWSWLP